MEYRKEKELKAQKEKVMNEYWEMMDPDGTGTCEPKNNFLRELNELCNLQSHYSAVAERLDAYEQSGKDDKKILQGYEDEVLKCQVEFYTAFVEFAKKFGNESSRVHSAMGSKTSELKKRTSAENGKKGGRPRKTPPETL